MLFQGSRSLDHLGVSQLLLIPWSRVLPEQLTVPQLVKKFPAVYGTQRFIAAFRRAQHLFLMLSHSNAVYSPHPTFLRFILILCFHLCLGLTSNILLMGFSTKPSMRFFCPWSVPHSQPILLSLIWSHKWYLVRSTDHKAARYVVFYTPLLPCPS